MPTWPDDLPTEFLEEGFNEEFGDHVVSFGDNVLRSEVDSGPAKRRPRFSGNSGSFRGVMSMTREQYQTFKAFYYNDLAQGALAFDFPDPDDFSDPRPMISVAFSTPVPRRARVRGTTHYVAMQLNLEP